MLGTIPATETPPPCFHLIRALLTCSLASCIFLLHPVALSAKSKPARAPRPEPELKVLELKISPNPYTVSSGSLEFSTLVQLPRELEGATILEVSSLVTSPSKAIHWTPFSRGCRPWLKGCGRAGRLPGWRCDTGSKCRLSGKSMPCSLKGNRVAKPSAISWSGSPNLKRATHES